MDRRRSRSKELGQNFLRSRRLAARLIGMSAIGTDDVVYEIGPGRGVLTQTLADRAARVVAIERDPLLARMLRRRFRTYKNVEIATCDILRYRIREQRPFKIISNVPYGITAGLMQKILYEQPIATEMHLIMQREAAEKFSGLGRRGETLQSVLAKVHFEFEILYRLRRDDFEPVPSVDSLMVKITRRPRSLLARPEQASFEAFVRRGFSAWKPSLRLALKREFSYKRWKRLARELGFALNARPSAVRIEQWLALFRARSAR